MIQKNQPFQLYTVLTGIDGPHVLITAGVHGDEYEPILVANALNTGLREMLKVGKVTIIPMVNPSAYYQSSRYGADGLDLARTCPGSEEGSATEIAAYHLSQCIEEADFYIDMHTGGAIFDIFPLCGYLLHPDLLVLKKQQAMARAINLPLIWGTEPSPKGRSLSVALKANVPAIYLEYGGGTTARREVVEAYYNSCLKVLSHLGMVESAKHFTDNNIYWLEDHSIDQGNLQIKMPASRAGIFVASVKLGDFISKGSIWGTITDPLNNVEEVVRADADGLVFLLRTHARVKTGESLGGILGVIKNRKIVLNG